MVWMSMTQNHPVILEMERSAYDSSEVLTVYAQYLYVYLDSNYVIDGNIDKINNLFQLFYAV